MEIKEQIKQKFDTDLAFAAALKAAKNGEEAAEAFRAAGFQLSQEDMLAMANAGSESLSEEQLEAVSGGIYVDKGGERTATSGAEDVPPPNWWIFW